MILQVFVQGSSTNIFRTYKKYNFRRILKFCRNKIPKRIQTQFSPINHFAGPPIKTYMETNNQKFQQHLGKPWIKLVCPYKRESLAINACADVKLRHLKAIYSHIGLHTGFHIGLNRRSYKGINGRELVGGIVLGLCFVKIWIVARIQNYFLFGCF